MRKQINWGEVYEGAVDYRVCHQCWRPIGPDKPVYWRRNADGIPEPFHVGCRN